MGQDGRGGDRAGEGRACEMLGLAVTADEARLSESHVYPVLLVSRSRIMLFIRYKYIPMDTILPGPSLHKERTLHVFVIRNGSSNRRSADDTTLEMTSLFGTTHCVHHKTFLSNSFADEEDTGERRA